MKKLVVCISTLVLLLFSVSANAVDTTPEASSTPDDTFVTIISAVFNGNGKVFNSNQEDITDTFCDTYATAYANGNYIPIFNDSFNCGVDYFLTNSHPVSQNSPRLIVGGQYSQTVSKKYTHTGTFFNGKTWYLNVTATGSMKYHDSTGTFTYFSSPTYSFVFSSLGQNFSGSINSVTPVTPPTMINNSTSAIFSLSVTHSVAATIGSVAGTFSTQTHEYEFEISAY